MEVLLLQKQSYSSPGNSKQYFLMSFPEINKFQPEISQLKGYRIGPVRPSTEGKKAAIKTKAESTSKKKPNSANRRPISPIITKPSSTLQPNHNSTRRNLQYI